MATEQRAEPGLSLLPASDRSITNRHLLFLSLCVLFSWFVSLFFWLALLSLFPYFQQRVVNTFFKDIRQERHSWPVPRFFI